MLKEISLEQAIKWSQYKIVPLDYEGVILAFNNAFNLCEGDVLSLKNITNDELKIFIFKLIEELVNYARKT